jgi:uncharacterized membrane protein
VDRLHVLSVLVARTGDAAAFRRVGERSRRVQLLGLALFGLALLAGLLTAILGGFNLTARWLLIAYGLVVVVLIYGNLWLPRQWAAVNAAAERGDEDLRRTASGQWAILLLGEAILLWLALIFVMVVKPFS